MIPVEKYCVCGKKEHPLNDRVRRGYVVFNGSHDEWQEILATTLPELPDENSPNKYLHNLASRLALVYFVRVDETLDRTNGITTSGVSLSFEPPLTIQIDSESKTWKEYRPLTDEEQAIFRTGLRVTYQKEFLKSTKSHP